MYVNKFEFVQYSGVLDLSLKAQLFKNNFDFYKKIDNQWSDGVFLRLCCGVLGFGINFFKEKIDSIQSLAIRGNWGRVQGPFGEQPQAI